VLAGLALVAAWILLYEASPPHRVAAPVVAPVTADDGTFTNLPPRTVAPAGGP
jgi:hypothetical protein